MKILSREVTVQGNDGGCKTYKVSLDYEDFSKLMKNKTKYVCSECIQTLNWEYDMKIKNVAADMWMRVEVESYDKKTLFLIDCDRFEFGVIGAVMLAQMVSASKTS